MIPWFCTLCNRSGQIEAPDPARERIRPLGLVTLERVAEAHGMACRGSFVFQEVDQQTADTRVSVCGGRQEGGLRVKEGVEK